MSFMAVATLFYLIFIENALHFTRHDSRKPLRSTAAGQGRSHVIEQLFRLHAHVERMAVRGPDTRPSVGSGEFPGEPGNDQSVTGISTPSQPEPATQEKPLWHYGGFIDLGYSLDFNFPDNHLFRNRSTTPRVNELDLNMAGVYVRKDATESSRWGTEWLVQAGEDSKAFGFDANLPKVSGSDVWRHFGRANVSYLAPAGNGLTLQAGLFNSFIGYESLYAKDNGNYTRAWIADYSPYLMFGVNAAIPVQRAWTGAFFIINDYFHLENSNSVPSYGATGTVQARFGLDPQRNSLLRAGPG